MKLTPGFLGIVISLFVSLPCLAKDIDWQKVLKDGYQQLTVGNTENAVAIFSKKVQKYPSSAECHTALGRGYKRLGKIDEAKKEFRQAVGLDPNYADGVYELGVLQEYDHQWSDAATSFEKYLQLKPEASDRQALTDRIRFCKDHINK